MNADIVLELLLLGVQNVGKIGGVIAQARAENRDVSDAELDGLFAADDLKRQELAAAIAKKRSGS